MGISNQPKGLATKYQQERLQLTRQAQAQDEMEWNSEDAVAYIVERDKESKDKGL